jgi:MOSC domain-containing protein YiiM
LDPGQARRNIVTRGIALNHLVEQEFRIGDVVLRGTRLCEPCAHMEKLTIKGTLRGLIHRGGLRAEIVKGGTIRVGDVIESKGNTTS